MTEDYSLDKMFESNKSMDKKDLRRREEDRLHDILRDDHTLEENKFEDMKTSIIITRDN